jgi:hypothetical protein
MKTTLNKAFGKFYSCLNFFKRINLLDSSLNLKQNYYLSFEGVDFTPKYYPDEAEIINLNGGSFLDDSKLAKAEIMKNFIGNYNKEAQTYNYHIIKKRSLWVWVASTSFIIVFIISIIHTKYENQAIDGIFKNYYNIPEISSSLFSIPSMAKNEQWSKALLLYEEHNYFQAREFLIRISEKSTCNYAMFLNAICLMQDGLYQEASGVLLKLQNDKVLSFEVNWYSALCYLKSGNISLAKTLFSSICNSESPFSKKAGEILPKIDKVH